MDDEVADVGVVHGFLRGAPPGRVGGPVVGIDADDVELAEIGELDPARVLQLAAEHQMQQLLGHWHHLSCACIAHLRSFRKSQQSFLNDRHRSASTKSITALRLT